MSYDQNPLDNHAIIEKMIYSRIPKYEILNKVFPSGVFNNQDGSSPTGMVVCIDLHTIINPLVADNFFEIAATYSRYHKTKLAGLIINLGGFIRNYLSKYHGMPCDIHFYYSFEDEVSGTPYRVDYHNSLNDKGEDAKKYILESLEMVKKFIRYVPFMWLVNTGKVMRHLAPCSIRKSYNMDMVKFLIMSNEVGMQYCVLNDRFFGLRLADKASKMVNRENIFNTLFKSTKPVELDGIHYATVVSMMGNERDGIVGLDGYGGVKAARLLEKQMHLTAAHCRLETLFESYPFILSDDQKKTVLANSPFHAANFNTQAKLSGLDEIVSIECMLDHINDIPSLKKVNDTFFKNEISLEMLLAGTN